MNCGSSPLTRGKRRARGRRSYPRGLIPAHAGKTMVSDGKVSLEEAHPRSRGENHPRLRGPPWPAGSSPLTRGKRSALLVPFGPVGLIPAHAGKTVYVYTEVITRRAHPRSRGENLYPLAPIRLTEGSSPLTRGKHYGKPRGKGNVGLIPAHAGKTSRSGPGCSCRSAHPRSRGENFDPTASWHPYQGSSPLTRGKRLIPKYMRPPTRLIPAHAGKTLSQRLTRCR